MEVLLELLIIEIIFLQSKFTHSYCTNVEIFSVPLNSYVYFSKVYSGQVPGAMVLTACLLSRRCSLLNEDTAERARQVFQTLVEVEYEALGGANNNNAQEEHDAEAGDEDSTSILHSLRKRICRDRERQIQVKFFVESLFTNYTCQAQDTTDTVSSVIEKYLNAPLEECKCLRCFDNLNN